MKTQSRTELDTLRSVAKQLSFAKANELGATSQQRHDSTSSYEADGHSSKRLHVHFEDMFPISAVESAAFRELKKKLIPVREEGYIHGCTAEEALTNNTSFIMHSAYFLVFYYTALP